MVCNKMNMLCQLVHFQNYAALMLDAFLVLKSELRVKRFDSYTDAMVAVKTQCGHDVPRRSLLILCWSSF